RRFPEADLARRAAEPRERAARRDVADRPATDASSAGRAVQLAPARAPLDQAGHHGLGAGKRARLASLGRSHRAGPLLHRTAIADARPEDPLAHAHARAWRIRPLQG